MQVSEAMSLSLDLNHKGYNEEQIYQLFYLYEHLLKIDKKDDFDFYLLDLKPKFSYKQLEQLVYCIINGIDYHIILDKNLSDSLMKELRCYLEAVFLNYDEEYHSKLYKLAELMIHYKFNSDIVAKLRGFVESNLTVNPFVLKLLVYKLHDYNVSHWMIVNYYLNIFNSGGSEALESALSDKNLNKLLAEYQLYPSKQHSIVLYFCN